MSSESLSTDAYFSALRDVADRFEHCVAVSAIHLPDQPLVFVNRQFERNTGYDADECLGRNCPLMLAVEYLSNDSTHYSVGMQRVVEDIDDPVAKLGSLRHGEVQAEINNSYGAGCWCRRS